MNPSRTRKLMVLPVIRSVVGKYQRKIQESLSQRPPSPNSRSQRRDEEEMEDVPVDTEEEFLA
jgi:hypothetical protein